MELDDLCKLCQTNGAVEVLGLTKDDVKSHLLSIEHTVLLHHADSLSQLNPGRIANIV